ncbi:MAG: class I SAM-dependent methyltransferase [Dysgonamonadaceae bacterium]|jgi:ubiquinone/menaquinone biosynthesis C-methylase UbiE|nr:class I SAM-dependent methyltransferase [Dysgonamonadaceae bacterium]
MSVFITYIAKQFGKPTGIGGELSTFIMNCMNRKQYRTTIEHLKITAADIVLDIGFGNGFLIKNLAKRNLSKLYGIEISSDMLTKASKSNQRYINSGKVELLLADVQNLPFEDSSINKIYTINTIYFWNSIPAGLAEIKRVLKPDGIFINTIYDKEWLDRLTYTQYGFTKKTTAQLKELTEQSGFKITETIEIEKNKSACIIASKVN